MKMEVQVNSVTVRDRPPLMGRGGSCVLITPPIDEGYWWMRVPVSDQQAVVCFPKFMTIGIGFQQEEDWNTNLPYTGEAQHIFDHISHNKGDDSIADADCVTAIEMLQAAIKQNLKVEESNGTP